MDLDENSIRGDHWEETQSYLATLKSSDLKKLLKTTQNDVLRMKTENSVFESFLQENEPSLISGMEKTMQKLQSMQHQFMSCTSIRSAAASEPRLTKTDDSSESSEGKKPKGPRINFSSKTDLALREYDTIQINLKEFKDYAHRYRNKMTAEIEENGIRGNEIKETMNNFEQQIVIDAVEELTQKIPAEKFVRYMQEWLRSSILTMEKLRLRRNNLRTCLKKLKLLLTQKEELGETVTEADFEQLLISNKNFLQEIDHKNDCILELKRMAGKVNLTVTTNKYLLAKQESYTKTMGNKFTHVHKQMQHLNLNYSRTIIELETSQKKIDSIKTIAKKYKVPDVMDYIRKKHELEEYRKRMKVWKRKVNLQNIVLHTYCCIMRQLTNTGRDKNEWLTKRKFTMNDDFLPQDLTLLIKRSNSRIKSNSRKNSKTFIG